MRTQLQKGASILGILSLLVVLADCYAGAAYARPVRRLFQPQDLELEDAGSFAANLSVDFIRGDDAYRLSVPDFELSLGIFKVLELDLEGESAIASASRHSHRLTHYAPDNLWASFKLGLLDFSDDEDHQAWALGVQLGPKLPIAQAARGVGVEGTALLGYRRGGATVVLNAGAVHDPRAGEGESRPTGPELGIDVNYPLDPDQRWEAGAGIGAVLYTSRDPAQATLLASISWAANEALTLSITGLGGLLKGGDRYGVLFGLSREFRVW